MKPGEKKDKGIFMLAEEINTYKSIKPLKYIHKETPHATIEPNRTCNIQCYLCYNIDRNTVKSLKEVKREINLVMKKRNLETITLLGGEVTLHPDIIKIILYIKSKGLKCQILTNGVLFLNDHSDVLLNRLINSGINRILLHIDTGQNHIHRSIDDVRNKLFLKLEKKKVHFALSMTIFNENKCTIPEKIKRYSRYKYFDGILAIPAKDPRSPDIQFTQLSDEYKSISSELMIEPTTYIPSNADDNCISWLIYYYFINDYTGKTLGVSSSIFTLFARLHKLFTGHHFFVIKMNPLTLLLSFLIVYAFTLITHPGKFTGFIRLLKSFSIIKSPRFQFIVIQNPPHIDYEKKQIQFCYHCPDATIRNNILTPVCLADLFDSPTNNSLERPVPSTVYHSVLRHLNEMESFKSYSL
ncbi:MAG: radical SAM protein [Spirochaetales bacterium]|nr:radical SAM protein [Spirochaetales bacterium]